jgi:hypothetical protein
VSVVVCLAVLALLLAVVCAIGLGFSALSPRTSGSAVLTFLSVAGLTVLSPIVFGLTLPAVTTTEDVRVWSVPATYRFESGEPPECVWRTEQLDRAHTERTWWLLAVNPFVILADAAPQARSAEMIGDPLSAIRTAVRSARTGPSPEEDWCTAVFTELSADGTPAGEQSPVQTPEPDRSLVWPYGLAVNLLLGAAGLVVAVRRLTVPQRRLARGTRVA